MFCGIWWLQQQTQLSTTTYKETITNTYTTNKMKLLYCNWDCIYFGCIDWIPKLGFTGSQISKNATWKIKLMHAVIFNNRPRAHKHALLPIESKSMVSHHPTPNKEDSNSSNMKAINGIGYWNAIWLLISMIHLMAWRAVTQATAANLKVNQWHGMHAMLLNIKPRNQRHNLLASSLETWFPFVPSNKKRKQWIRYESGQWH